MTFRLTTWNVNGIRNPFSYEPWRGTQSFQGMFDLLEADIIVLQELKIQRKDLRDDMVLVPGWDCFFSLPKYKKGYSGVAIYTRNATCSPIYAEEGVTGILCPPNSTSSYRELPESEQIGGYPTDEQLSTSELSAETLDSEGRCVILEFPAFVLLGVYCPANRDETRDGFRLGFLNALDHRIRNLISLGKRVVVAGDLNISRDEIDSAHALEQIRKSRLTTDEFLSSPARIIFNRLVEGGRVSHIEGVDKKDAVLWDMCRSFFPARSGMYTCWEQRINARPGNFGARIDYILCSLDMKDWMSIADIQEGLMGSDHCPVYAIFKENVDLHGDQIDFVNLMNPSVDFEAADNSLSRSHLPLSGRLIPEFNRRRNIRDMFLRQSSTQNPSPGEINQNATSMSRMTNKGRPISLDLERSHEIDERDPKRRKKEPIAGVLPTTSQKSIRGFFSPRQPRLKQSNLAKDCEAINDSVPNERKNDSGPGHRTSGISPPDASPDFEADPQTSQESTTVSAVPSRIVAGINVMSSIPEQESWNKIFKKRPPPRCEGHEEPCVRLVTKKPGINRGRSFWICPRPLGPSGNKETGTQWRCPTFIWCSDWNSKQ
ncbi:exodeoxyribonuclease III (xth) [Coccidioides immitis RS]|uniref:DNA-(apurinic or apyrimidinic site) endonuclease 2 n=1 Tax=Coccidioides immitis (strain RS) TaxID=246410 RepID=J3KGY1_COCIM|nr:exodeoxyribonuclease III (xth) [Coccidioides immitis RS]EAS35051.3 exodeoxyribonuclease III (xth) [Coccidioides immitis RS]